jgi:hypothetical protein
MKHVLKLKKISSMLWATFSVSLTLAILVYTYSISNNYIVDNQKKILNDYYEIEESKLEQLANSVYEEINYSLVNSENKIDEITKLRVDQAYDTIINYYQNHQEMSNEEIIKDVADSYRSLNNETGEYFFMITSDYESILDNSLLQYDRSTIENLEDITGKKFVREIVQTAIRKGSGYITYYWPREQNEVAIKKKSYVRYIEFLDLVVGTGIYIEDNKEFIKTEVLKSLDRIGRTTKNFAVYDSSGYGVINKNSLVDKNFKKIIENVNEYGETFYYLGSRENLTDEFNILYVRKYDELDWYIVSFTNVGYINKGIDEYESQSSNYLKKLLGGGLLIIALSAVILLIFEKRLLNIVLNRKKDKDIFVDYIMDNIETAILVVDKNFVIEHCNYKGKEVLGFKIFSYRKYNLKKFVKDINFSESRFETKIGNEDVIIETKIIEEKMIVNIFETV